MERLEAEKGRHMAAAKQADTVRIHAKGGYNVFNMECHGKREGDSPAETSTVVAGMDNVVACR